MGIRAMPVAVSAAVKSKKPRSEMTPEEKALDNQLSRERKREQAGLPVKTKPGGMMASMGNPSSKSQGGKPKPRSEMTPEEKAEDNRISRERKKIRGAGAFVGTGELHDVGGEKRKLKSRSEMTPEEREEDNRLSKARKALMTGRGIPRKNPAAQGGMEGAMAAMLGQLTGFSVNGGKKGSAGGGKNKVGSRKASGGELNGGVRKRVPKEERKSRADMTPEERAEDNRITRERKAAAGGDHRGRKPPKANFAMGGMGSAANPLVQMLQAAMMQEGSFARNAAAKQQQRKGKGKGKWGRR